MNQNRCRLAIILALTVSTVSTALAGGGDSPPRIGGAPAVAAFEEGVRNIKQAELDAFEASRAGRFGYAAALPEDPVRRYEQAIDEFTRAIALDPGLAQALLHRGETYLVLRRPAKAEADLVELRQIDPLRAATLEAAIAAYWERGRMDREGDGC